MTLFDEREQAFKASFLPDGEMRFRALVRRNELLGIWAAERLRLKGAEAKRYIQELVETVVKPNQEELILERLHRDLNHLPAVLPESEIRATMRRALAQAIKHIKAGTRLSADLRPIHDLELALGNRIAWTAEPAGTACPYAVGFEQPLHFDDIEHCLTLPQTIIRWSSDDPHWGPPEAGYRCEVSRHALAGPMPGKMAR